MDKRILTKGYSVIDLIVSMIIISIVSLIYLRYVDMPSFDYELLAYDIWNIQLDAMINNSDMYLSDEYPSCRIPNELYFNEKGNISRAMSIECIKRKYTLQLGFGRVFYE